MMTYRIVPRDEIGDCDVNSKAVKEAGFNVWFKDNCIIDKTYMPYFTSDGLSEDAWVCLYFIFSLFQPMS
jgi:hypothetical protein